MIDQTKESLHHRRSIRLAGYDYTAEGGYFITCVAQARVCLFGEVVNGVMNLNGYGEIVKEEWFKTKSLRDNIELIDEEFVVMPNHIHGIIWLIDDGVCRGTARCAPTDMRCAPTDMRCAPTPDEQFGKMIPKSIPTIVRAYKSAVTKQINLLRQTPGEPVWQRNYYEHIIRSEKDYDNIANYIYDNPLCWEKDDENQPA